MNNIAKRLKASLEMDAINGDSLERSICACQMQEAANRIEQLEREVQELQQQLDCIPST